MIDFSFLYIAENWINALGIFALLLCTMVLETLRMLFVFRGIKLVSWVLGLITSFVSITALGSALAQMDNPLIVCSYAAGFATGNVLGIFVENRLALGHMQLSIISIRSGLKVAKVLRENGFGLTEISASGKDGTVVLLHCDVLRRDIKKAKKLIHSVDSTAFVTAKQVHSIRLGGFWRPSTTLSRPLFHNHK